MNRPYAVLAFSILLAAGCASAQSVWTGGGADARWSTAGNWQDGIAPVPDMLTSLTFGGSVTDAQNDFLSGSAFSNLTFAAGASTFGLSGNGISLSGNLSNGSGVAQTIANDVVWAGSKRTLDTGPGGIVLNGYLSVGAANASFYKSGSGVLTLGGGGNFNVNDANYISAINAGTVVITKDITINRVDIQNNARLIVTNNATLSGFTSGGYGGFWQASTIDLYSGKINVSGSATLLAAQDWSKTCIVNVRGGTFVGSNMRWCNNGNILLTLSGDGEFQWLSGNPLAENGGCWLTMNGGTFRRGSSGSDTLDVGYVLSGAGLKQATTITNRIAFNAGAFVVGSFTYATTKTNIVTTLLFNGGVVRAGKTASAFFGTQPDLIASTVGAGGLVFDTQSYTVTFNDALETGGGADGGLVKLGDGTLILSTNCTYAGQTTVSNGLLRIDAPLASSGLRLSPYASGVLADASYFSGGLTVECGATFAFTTNATTVLSLSTLTPGSARGPGLLAFEVADETTLDQIAVASSGGLDLTQGGAVLLYQPGTTARFAVNGTYPLISYSGSLVGSVDNLRVANPDPSKSYQFSDSGSVVSLTVSDGSGAEWTASADGNWSVDGNWSGGAPNAVGSVAQFLAAATAPLTVTLDASATVGGLIFSNAAAPYTLAGGATLTLDNGTQQADLLVQDGSHTVSAPLAFAGAVVAQPASGATLTLAGDLSGAGVLTVTGEGSVSLSGTNQTQTVVLDGTLAIADGASLGGGSRFDDGVLAITADTAIGSAFEIGPRDATVEPDAGVTATLAAPTSGEGALCLAGGGTFVLAAALGNTGGVCVNAGTLDFTNDVFGTAPLTLSGGAARYAGADTLALGAPITVGGNATLRAEQAPLTLSGTLGYSASATLAVECPEGLTLAGTAKVTDTGRKLQLLEGTLTLASGADYTLSGGARDTVVLGQDANKQTELVIESGARLKTGGIHMNATSVSATNCLCTIRQEGGQVEVTYTDGLFIRDYGTSDGLYLMNGGTFTAPVSSWTSVGSKGHGYLTVNGGLMTLGRFAMGVSDNASYAYGGPGGHIAVNGGRLAIAGQCSWMSDAYADRFNTVVVGNGTPDEGELDLVATTRLVPYSTGSGRTAITFDGGLLKTLGLASYGSSALTNYLYGADTLTVRSGGAVIETPGSDVTFVQPLCAAETNGGVVKRGMAALTLSATNNVWCGLTDVQAGTLRARLNQTEQHLYPEGLLALWTFDDGTPADRSGNGFDLLQQNDTNLVEFVGGGSCGKAARFSGLSSLKMPYDPAFNINTYSVSLWVNLGIKNSTHQGFFSTRVDTSELGAGGTFDFKFNASSYISCYNSAVGGAGVSITAAMGGNLDVGTWHMVTYVVQSGRMDAYLDGVWKDGVTTNTPTLLTSGHLLTIGRGHSSSTEPIREVMAAGGMIDDVAVFARALSADEIAALYDTVVTPRPPVRVAEAATFDLLGSTNITADVSGGGTISGGVLVVTGSITPESDAGAPVLTVENLAFDGSNVVYACASDDATNALVRVTGALSVSESGVIDLGHTAADPIDTPFRRTVMTYGALDPADAVVMQSWTVTGDGGSGSLLRAVIVDDVNKCVKVEVCRVGLVILVK